MGLSGFIFGAAISCSHFQKFSDAVAHLVAYRTGRSLVNYLDDFLFAALMAYLCNLQLKVFMQVCCEICFPVSLEKTYWASTRLVFLRLLIDTIKQLVMLACEKIAKGRELIINILEKTSKKVTVHQIQKLTGFLNFLGRGIIPGRAFT